MDTDFHATLYKNLREPTTRGKVRLSGRAIGKFLTATTTIAPTTAMAEYGLSKTIIHTSTAIWVSLLAHLFETSFAPDKRGYRGMPHNMNLPRAPTCLTHRLCLSKSIAGRRFLLVRYFPSIVVRNPNRRSLEFDEKRENAVSANERLQLEVQAVLEY